LRGGPSLHQGNQGPNGKSEGRAHCDPATGQDRVTRVCPAPDGARDQRHQRIGGGSPPPEEKDVWVATLAQGCTSTLTYVPARKRFRAPCRVAFHEPRSTRSVHRGHKAVQDRCPPWLFPDVVQVNAVKGMKARNSPRERRNVQTSTLGEGCSPGDTRCDASETAACHD
jgi:hypothetical protein